MKKGWWEPPLLALGFVSWGLAALNGLGWGWLRGSFSMGLEPLFALSAALGWVSGNLYKDRTRKLLPRQRGRFFLLYFVATPGVLFLLRAMAPEEHQEIAPLVPYLALAVFAIFFLVPVTLGRVGRSRGPE